MTVGLRRQRNGNRKFPIVQILRFWPTDSYLPCGTAAIIDFFDIPIGRRYLHDRR